MKTLGYKAPRISEAEYKAIKLLLETRRRGVRQKHIARQVGRTNQTINRIFKSNSYLEYKNRWKPETKNNEMKGGEDMETKRTNNPWTKEQVFVLLGMADAGNNNEEIGKVLERTSLAIHQLLSRIKLYRKGTPRNDRINKNIYGWVDEYYSVPRVAGVARFVEDRPMPTINTASQDPLDKLDSIVDSLKEIVAEVVMAEVDKRMAEERAEFKERIKDLETLKQETQRSSIKGLLSNWRS